MALAKGRLTPALRHAAALMVVGALALAGCGSSGSKSAGTVSQPATGGGAPAPSTGRPPVTLGTKNFTEQLVLGQLYTQALRAKGFPVTLKSNIGASEVVDRELAGGRIDGYPEYTGTILSVLAHDATRPASALQAYPLGSSASRAGRLEPRAFRPYA